MSRFDYEEDDGERHITPEMWQHNARLALQGKRGQQALRDLRAALLALPAPRLIGRALCTFGATQEVAQATTSWQRTDLAEYILAQGGEGVCAVGAYIWWQKVKSGVDPQVAFSELPRLYDDDSSGWETADAGRRAGLTMTLAWELGQRNDDIYGDMTPEERYIAFLAWIDQELGYPDSRSPNQPSG